MNLAILFCPAYTNHNCKSEYGKGMGNRMQRYFLSPQQFGKNHVQIVGDDVHHIVRVMRMRVGDELICSDGWGRDVLARITRILPDEVQAEILAEMKEQRELPVEVAVAQALPKGDKMDWVIQKGTELGASSFIPFHASRSVVQLDGKKAEKRLLRWQKIAKEAAEQAHRSILPQVHAPTTWHECLSLARDYPLRLMANEMEDSARLSHLLPPQCPPRLFLLIGPEGGWTEEEVSQAQEAGFLSVSLGKRILRTETAALYVLSALSFRYE